MKYRQYLLILAAVLWGVFAIFIGVAKGQFAIIKGEEMPLEPNPAIVHLMNGEHGCSASVVGRHALLTAGHCGASGTKATVYIGSRTYEATMFASPAYNASFNFLEGAETPDLDLAVGFVAEELTEVAPLSIGGVASLGEAAMLFGYGCTEIDGDGDGNLHSGSNTIQKFLGSGFLLSGAGKGAIGCSGDSGGPTLVAGLDGKWAIIGVHSQSDFTTSTWDIRTDSAEARAFFREAALRGKVNICGITDHCP